MKMIIFTTHNLQAIELAEKLVNAHVITSSLSNARKTELLHYFVHTDKINTLVCTQSMVSGWRAPKDTLVLFDGAAARQFMKEEISQAEGRPMTLVRYVGDNEDEDEGFETCSTDEEYMDREILKDRRDRRDL